MSNHLDQYTINRLVSRFKSLASGEVITNNEASVRLCVFEGTIPPEDAMRELSMLGCKQLEHEHSLRVQQSEEFQALADYFMCDIV